MEEKNKLAEIMKNIKGMGNPFKEPEVRCWLALAAYWGLLSMMAGYVYELYCAGNTEQAKYVVTAKDDHKVSYMSPDAPDAPHVLEFGENDRDNMMYRNMNVGDTILGRKNALDKPVVPASHPRATGKTDSRVSPVYKINGQTLRKIKAQEKLATSKAIRDSILREVQQSR